MGRGSGRLALFALLACLLGGCLASLNGWDLWLHPNYVGEVRDGGDGKPVADAQVVWVERSLSVKTDVLGRFRFDGEQVRKHVVPFGDVGVIYTFRVFHHLYEGGELRVFYVKYTLASKPEIKQLESMRLQRKGAAAGSSPR